MFFGISFSHRQIEYLGLDVEAAFTHALVGKFSHIRLGTCWSEVQPTKETFDFSLLENLLSQCEAAGQPVIVTVGVKAPRWPEFYWPDWIEEKDFEDEVTKKLLLEFVAETIERLKKFTCITHWQLENEPLDPSGPDQVIIPLEVLQLEKVAIRRLDPRPILVTLWGNEMKSRNTFESAAQIGDEVGLDLYPKQFMTQVLGKSLYEGPRASDDWLRKTISQSEKPVWITELQAEPWEASDGQYRSNNPQSLSPEQFQKNLEWTQSLQPTEILLWGFEYWLFRQCQGDDRYIKIVENLH